jgi:hypothetical protein
MMSFGHGEVPDSRPEKKRIGADARFLVMQADRYLCPTCNGSEQSQ